MIFHIQKRNNIIFPLSRPFLKNKLLGISGVNGCHSKEHSSKDTREITTSRVGNEPCAADNP